MSKHTPGPWAKDKWGTLKGSNGETVMEYNSGAALATLPTPESDANTHLRNAAPDLLEALKQMDRQVMDLTAAIDLDDRTTAHACLDRLRAIQQAAIRKAEEGK